MKYRAVSSVAATRVVGPCSGLARGARDAARDADAWCDAWEVTVEARGIHPEDAAYWTGATTWIAQQRKTRKLPT